MNKSNKTIYEPEVSMEDRDEARLIKEEQKKFNREEDARKVALDELLEEEDNQ